MLKLKKKPSKEPSDNCLRVLICEDQSVLRGCMQNILEKAGFKVLAVADGESFLSKIIDFDPQVVLLDINLPDTNGMILQNKLRQWDGYAEIPVIFVSTYSVPKKPHCYALKKPFNGDQLVQKVWSVCNGLKKHHNYL
jgi:CheY-like chemotaxis protein